MAYTKEQIQELIRQNQHVKSFISEHQKSSKPSFSFMDMIERYIDERIAGLIAEMKPRDGYDGYTPIKGKDYFTEEELKQMLKYVTPVKGKHYFDGMNGKDGKNGIDGIDGKDGKDGKNGQDGRDGKDVKIEDIFKVLTGKDIVRLLRSLRGKDKLNIMDINDPTKTPLDMRWHGGGQKINVFDLSDSLNGVTKSFTIPTNKLILDVSSSSAPFRFRPTTDYTGSGTTTLTFTSAISAATQLATGQTLVIVYVQ